MTNIFYPFIIFCIRLWQKLEKKLFTLLPINYVEKIARAKFRRSGITINGENPWDIQIRDKEFYCRAHCDGTLGLGESYMEGHWDCDDLEGFVYRAISSGMYERHMQSSNKIANYLLLHLFNLQTKARTLEVGQKHYDLGNDFFASFLDKSMNYSCGYWKTADNLDQAQLDKMELIAQKLKLKPGMRVLDIGCGWGSLCKYLAENHKVQMVGCTISVEQAKQAQNNCQDLPVDIRLIDYRDINEKFDRIVSVGMFEHVGPSNYKTFFEVANNCLVDDGIFLLHTIGVSHPKELRTDQWYHKYIFPNGILPYHMDIHKSIENLFILEDWHNFGHDYYKTLMAWYQNFIKAWPHVKQNRGVKFYRMWVYYLLLSAGCFRSRRYQLWQIVLTKNGLIGGYQSVR